MTRYFAIDYEDTDGLEADPAWLLESSAELFCSACARLRHDVPIAGVEVSTMPPPDVSSNFIKHPLLGVMRKDLLNAMGEEVLPFVRHGALRFRGNELENWRFLRPKNRILVRGGPRSTHHGYCKKCGRLYYWPQRFDDCHLLRSSLVGGLPIYSAVSVFAVVREDVYARLAARKFSGICLYELPILDSPQDGFPDDLPLWAEPGSPPAERHLPE